ncbi:MAG TPA: hypothetical protein VEI02_12520 [Planctomycetota bacterium]|nr:hypothetical protein [Planctomycetota bacterium]
MDGTEIEKQLEEIAWLGSRGDSMFSSAAEPENQARFRSAWAVLMRLDGVARSLSACAEFPGIKRVLERSRSLALPSMPDGDYRTQGELEAWDVFFEIECAARLRGLGEVSFDEPDIRIVDDGAILSVACKRPRRKNAIAKAVHRGTKQIVRQKSLGLIAVGLDVDVSAAVSGPDGSSTWDQSQSALRGLVEEVASDVKLAMRSVATDAPHGPVYTVFMLRTVAIQPGPPGYTAIIPRFHYKAVAAEASPFSEPLEDLLVERMIASEPRFP